MAYIDNFVPVRHSFLVSRDYTAVEKLVLLWLASKPADWDVKPEQVRTELGIGPDAVKRTLHSLRSKGAITKPASERRPDGTYRRPPGRLAVRDEVRHITAGRTEGGFTDSRSTDRRFPDLPTKEGKTNERTNPAGRYRPDVTSSSPVATPPNSLADGSERSERRVTTADVADMLCPLGCGEVNYPGHENDCQRNPWSDSPADPWSDCRRLCEMCNPIKLDLTGKVPEPTHALCRGRCHPKSAA